MKRNPITRYRIGVWKGIAPLLLLLLMLASWVSIPTQAHAHAIAELKVPEPNTQMNESPPRVEIHFNEQIEMGMGGVQVLDSLSKSVTEEKSSTSVDRRIISLALPKLDEGIYTVSYSVVSADGHPVSGSYIFVVGNPPNAKDASVFDQHEQIDHSSNGTSTEISANKLLLYTSRGLYYAFLMMSTGLMFWYGLLRNNTEAQERLLYKWGLWVVRVFVIASIFYVFIHARDLMQDQPSTEWSKLFTTTEIGISWLILIVLVFVGILVLKSGTAVKMIWATALLILEGLNGHAAVYEPKWYSLLLDVVHLGGAAIWAGGLSFLLLLWLKDRKEAGRFAVAFSQAAWISIILLTLTGTLSVLLFLPSLSYLFYTSWGVLLLIKTSLVLMVIVIGALLRLRVRRGDLLSGNLLKLDGSLMAAILIVVGIFTYISPLPANTPYSKHVIEADKQITLRITPNVPGENQFIVKVWLLEKTGEPKRVKLLLHSLDKPKLGAIEIPLNKSEDKDNDNIPDFIKSTYQATGQFIPFPGKWKAEIRILTQEDNEMVHEEAFRNY
ncbi:copper resistance CopC/CopD family protein [Paenibacillus sp. GCM10012306]|uniref:copper resistance CopC/CopD family protein n=1 Tax=Paenibacillus sp. GCM10012306 TaxID=3317342 RepID=UPI00361B8349